MKNILILFLSMLILACGRKKEDFSMAEQELITTDLAFSDMSMEKGISVAFEYFAHKEAVLLRPDRYPIEGYDKVLGYLRESEVPGSKLSWQPVKAIISECGDMGYTYGVYVWAMDTVNNKGNYLSIWKKNEEGEWKYVLDTGNPGLGE